MECLTALAPLSSFRQGPDESNVEFKKSLK